MYNRRKEPAESGHRTLPGLTLPWALAGCHVGGLCLEDLRLCPTESLSKEPKVENLPTQADLCPIKRWKYVAQLPMKQSVLDEVARRGSEQH